jgi:hypothetical protein
MESNRGRDQGSLWTVVPTEEKEDIFLSNYELSVFEITR